jgi:hypothetical protein
VGVAVINIPRAISELGENVVVTCRELVSALYVIV